MFTEFKSYGLPLIEEEMVARTLSEKNNKKL